jgi:hypothetical protein
VSDIRSALGSPIPAASPATVVRGVTIARDAIDRVHDRTKAPFQVVLERMFGIIDNKALFIVVDLGIPDLLVAGAQTAAELAEATGVEQDALGRLLRYLDSRGVFRADRQGRYANNPVSDFLRADHDWADDECVRILETVARAMAPGSPVAVIEPHIERGPASNFAKASDLLMLALTSGGRERSLAEFDALWRRAGLMERRRIVLPSLFDVFELVPLPR